MAGRDFVENKIRVVSVTGPTASGKTKLAVELAKEFDGEIISADSMQIYKGMTIATAKPDEEEKQGIPHHLMGFLEPSQTYSVAMFVSDASRLIYEIRGRGKLPIICGGTGLYVDSLLNNIKFSEEQRDEKLSSELRNTYENEGVEGLLSILKEFDQPSFDRLKAERNPRRVIRAIEFYKTTGKTITEQIENSRQEQSPFAPIKICLNYRSREVLYDRINKRVDIMLRQGLLEEAEKVLKSELSFTSVKAIGYKELEPYFKNEKTLEECIEKLKMETRRYAKRQITWFKRDKEANFLYPDDYQCFEELLAKAVKIIRNYL